MKTVLIPSLALLYKCTCIASMGMGMTYHPAGFIPAGRGCRMKIAVMLL